MGHNFKKNFGQNFLKSSKFVHKLLDPLNLTANDLVIEIGPGDGIVTKSLLESEAQTLCVEIDYDLIAKLIKKFIDMPNFKIVNEDFLKVDLDQIISDNNVDGGIKFAGSLPYNVSKKIIRKLLDFNYRSYIANDFQIKREIDSMAFIVQDEVAKIYSAKPPYTEFLAVISNIFADVKKLESIPASQFHPKPKVNGGIIFFKLKTAKQIKELLAIKKNEALAEAVKEFETLVRIGFSSPRKKVSSNIKHSRKYEDKKIEKAFEKLKIDDNTRASQLDFQTWVEIWKKLKN